MQENSQDISSDEEEAPAFDWPSEDMVSNLERDLKENFNGMFAKEYVKKRAVFEYLVCLLKGEKKMKASMDVVNMIYNSNSKSKATWIWQMANYWCINNALPPSRREKHQKVSRIIDDEDIAEMCYKWI